MKREIEEKSNWSPINEKGFIDQFKQPLAVEGFFTMDVEDAEASLQWGELSERVLESLKTWRDVVFEGDLSADVFNEGLSALIDAGRQHDRLRSVFKLTDIKRGLDPKHGPFSSAIKLCDIDRGVEKKQQSKKDGLAKRVLGVARSLLSNRVLKPLILLATQTATAAAKSSDDAENQAASSNYRPTYNGNDFTVFQSMCRDIIYHTQFIIPTGEKIRVEEAMPRFAGKFASTQMYQAMTAKTANGLEKYFSEITEKFKDISLGMDGRLLTIAKDLHTSVDDLEEYYLAQSLMRDLDNHKIAYQLGMKLLNASKNVLKESVNPDRDLLGNELIALPLGTIKRYQLGADLLLHATIKGSDDAKEVLKENLTAKMEGVMPIPAQVFPDQVEELNDSSPEKIRRVIERNDHIYTFDNLRFGDQTIKEEELKKLDHFIRNLRDPKEKLKMQVIKDLVKEGSGYAMGLVCLRYAKLGSPEFVYWQGVARRHGNIHAHEFYLSEKLARGESLSHQEWAQLGVCASSGWGYCSKTLGFAYYQLGYEKNKKHVSYFMSQAIRQFPNRPDFKVEVINLYNKLIRSTFLSRWNHFLRENDAHIKSVVTVILGIMMAIFYRLWRYKLARENQETQEINTTPNSVMLRIKAVHINGVEENSDAQNNQESIVQKFKNWLFRFRQSSEERDRLAAERKKLIKKVFGPLKLFGVECQVDVDAGDAVLKFIDPVEYTYINKKYHVSGDVVRACFLQGLSTELDSQSLDNLVGTKIDLAQISHNFCRQVRQAIIDKSTRLTEEKPSKKKKTETKAEKLGKLIGELRAAYKSSNVRDLKRKLNGHLDTLSYEIKKYHSMYTEGSDQLVEASEAQQKLSPLEVMCQQLQSVIDMDEEARLSKMIDFAGKAIKKCESLVARLDSALAKYRELISLKADQIVEGTFSEFEKLINELSSLKSQVARLVNSGSGSMMKFQHALDALGKEDVSQKTQQIRERLAQKAQAAREAEAAARRAAEEQQEQRQTRRKGKEEREEAPAQVDDSSSKKQTLSQGASSPSRSVLSTTVMVFKSPVVSGQRRSNHEEKEEVKERYTEIDPQKELGIDKYVDEHCSAMSGFVTPNALQQFEEDPSVPMFAVYYHLNCTLTLLANKSDASLRELARRFGNRLVHHPLSVLIGNRQTDLASDSMIDFVSFYCNPNTKWIVQVDELKKAQFYKALVRNKKRPEFNLDNPMMALHVIQEQIEGLKQHYRYVTKQDTDVVVQDACRGRLIMIGECYSRMCADSIFTPLAFLVLLQTSQFTDATDEILNHLSALARVALSHLDGCIEFIKCIGVEIDDDQCHELRAQFEELAENPQYPLANFMNIFEDMLDNNPSLRDLNKVFCWLQDVKRTVRNFVRHHLVSDEATQTAFDALMADESLSPQQKPWVKIKVLVEAGAGEDNSVMMVIDGMLEGIKEIEENAQMQVSEGVVLGV